MPNLETILRNQFGFTDSHFDEDGHVHVNSMDGTISAMPGASAHSPCLFLRITDILKVGDEITIRASTDHGRRESLRIIDINAQGLSAIRSNGQAGFFPWEILSFGISCPSQMDVTSMAHARDTPLSTLRATNRHMERRLAKEKAAVQITEGLLAAIVNQMPPAPPLARLHTSLGRHHRL